MNSFAYDAIFLEKLYRTEPSDLRQKQVMDELKDALNRKYGTEILVCRFAEEHKALAIDSPYKIILYSKSAEDLERIKLGWQGYSEECYNAVEQVFSNSEFGKTYPFEKVQVFHVSLKRMMKDYCYESVSKDEYVKLKSNLFNPATMESLDGWHFQLIYKNKDLLEAAKASGEVDMIVKRYYEVVKKHDKYNVINMDNYAHYVTSMEEVEANGGWFGFHHNVWY